MSKHGFLSALLFLGAILAGCATASVSSDYDRATDFSALKTYAWAEDQASGDLRFDAPDLRETIRQSVEAELQAKGLQKVAGGDADALLKYYITVEQKKEVAGGSYPPVFNSRGAYAGAAGPNSFAAREMMTFHYEEGTFVLDMLDPKSGDIIWRGSLESMVDPGATPAKRIERVPAAVAKVLKNFPPSRK